MSGKVVVGVRGVHSVQDAAKFSSTDRRPRKGSRIFEAYSVGLSEYLNVWAQGDKLLVEHKTSGGGLERTVLTDGFIYFSHEGGVDHGSTREMTFADCYQSWTILSKEDLK